LLFLPGHLQHISALPGSLYQKILAKLKALYLLFLPGHLQHLSALLAAFTNVLAKFKAPFLLFLPDNLQHKSALLPWQPLDMF
jgi:hypothetical protein